MADETPMMMILCPLCARMAKLKTWSGRTPGVPRRDAIEALYECEDHEIRFQARDLPRSFGGAA